MIGQFCAAQVAAQRGRLFLWVPVAMALGIGAYFSIRFEPSSAALWLVAVLVIGIAAIARRVGETLAPVLHVLALVLFGFLWAALRAHLVAEPVLQFRFYGPIEGRVVVIDRSVSDKLRLTLDQPILGRIPQARTPAKVRVSLHGQQPDVTLQPGLRVILTGHLSPPSGPVEPGGFDFRRQAWFQKIGAVGYTRTPVLILDDPVRPGWRARLDRGRQRLSHQIRARIPGQAGAMAAAITTGDRSGLSRDTLEDMRHSNLAHLLAISGLHVGLLTAVVFGAVRGGIALIPFLALRVQGKKWAAVIALLASAAYLLVSGGTVSTQRAFIMVAVMLCAVLADRRAITLRAVALAAVIVLLIRPESLLGPGFQMSFAATTALVWGFGILRDLDLPRVPRLARGPATLVFTSAVAGLATAPFAAAHFNQVANYGLLANLAAVPVMGAIVAPAAVLAGALALVGLAAPALWVMEQGLQWILSVAAFVSAQDHALRFVISPETLVLPLLTFGALWAILWRGRGLVLGLAISVGALVVWQQTTRPEILISDTGGLVGIMTPQGRALNKLRGDGFAAQSWLENDGLARERDAAHARAGPLLNDKILLVSVEDTELRWASGKRAACGDSAILVTPAKDPSGTCLHLGHEALRLTGAIALKDVQSTWQVTSVGEVSGHRLWTPTSPDQKQKARQILTRLEAELNGPAQ